MGAASLFFAEGKALKMMVLTPASPEAFTACLENFTMLRLSPRSSTFGVVPASTFSLRWVTYSVTAAMSGSGSLLSLPKVPSS